MPNYQEEKYFSIRSWSEEDRPREKLLHKGKAALSDAELIAILIGSGTVSESAVSVARKVLSLADNDLYQLGKLSISDLTKVAGIGKAKAITIISALELGRRRKDVEPQKRDKITSASQVYDIMKPHMLDLPIEEMWGIYLNRANKIIKTIKLSGGGVNATIVDARVVFKPAMELLASGLILVHNHPSGTLNPSFEDDELTKKIQKASRDLQVNFLDHLIFTDRNYYSYADQGKL